MNQKLIRCPLCPWTYEPKPLPPDVNHYTLASVFGPGIMLQRAINKRSEETERDLAQHFKTHTTVEWLTKVTELLAEIDRLKTQCDFSLI